MGVVGGADHGLKVFDLFSMQTIKTLYNRHFGHTEWVTCCRCLSDGRIVSGGMDNKICLWDSFLKNTANNLMSIDAEIDYDRASPARCVELLGHEGSISQVEVNAANTLLLSASYDRTLRLYKIPMFNISAKRKESAILTGGHKGAITHFNWNYNYVLSGDKRGIVKVWDLQEARPIHSLSTKKGAVTALRSLYLPTSFMPPQSVGGSSGSEYEVESGFDKEGTLLPPLINAYGDASGALSVVDVRTNGLSKVFSEVIHPGGALTDIHFLFNNSYYGTGSDAPHSYNSSSNNNHNNTGNYHHIPPVVTCGADRRIHILEPRMSFRPLHTLTSHRDFIYSLNVLNHYNRREHRFQSLILSGDGEGRLIVTDANEGKELYELHPSTAAVRQTAALPGLLACAGDDGKATVYYF